MSTINNISADHSIRDAGAIERNTQRSRVQARIEVSYCDAAKVGSFAVSEDALPGLGAGDQIYVSSGGVGAYRTVLSVEPIAGGAVMILLDPGHATVAPPVSIK